MRQAKDYRIAPFPKYRRWMAAAYQSVRRRSMIHGLVEIDVTHARRLLRVHKQKTGESLSFTAFVISCLAKAIDEDKAVQAFCQGRRRLVVFDDVDVNLVVEHDRNGEKYIIPCIIRAANRKTFREINNAIRAAQRADVNRLLKGFWPQFLPALLIRPFLRVFTTIADRYPRLWKWSMGTVSITSVGMFGAGAGWGIPNASPMALVLTMGGIGEKPVMLDEQIALREYLCVTISVNHAIVDGAPAARFAHRLKELIESGYGLDDLLAGTGSLSVGTTAVV